MNQITIIANDVHDRIDYYFRPSAYVMGKEEMEMITIPSVCLIYLHMILDKVYFHMLVVG